MTGNKGKKELIKYGKIAYKKFYEEINNKNHKNKTKHMTSFMTGLETGVNYEHKRNKLKQELTHLKETEIPRCLICSKNFIKIEKESSQYHSTWKPNCEHGSKLRLSVG